MDTKKIAVSAAEFYLAVKNSKKFKRRPAGTNAHVPDDTLLTPKSPSRLLIETPMKNTEIQSNGRLDKQISIDAKLLEKAAEIQKDCGTLFLSYSDEMIFLEGKTTLRIPRLK